MTTSSFNLPKPRESNSTSYGNNFHGFSNLYAGRTGSGENQIDNQAEFFFGGTGAKIYTFNVTRLPEHTVEQHAQTTADQINCIQAALGITISDLAKSLGVERQTVYSWMRPEDQTVLQARTRVRLNEIREYARQWNIRSTRPANKLIATLDLGNGTLLDLLKKPELDQRAIQEGLDVLAKRIETIVRNKQKSLSTSITPPETSDDRILRRATSLQFRSPSEE